MRPAGYFDITERLKHRVIENAAGCWLWTKLLHDQGYARGSMDGRHGYIHRLVYEILVGPIPAGMQLDHLCRVRHCVNPDHLEVVDQRTNILRGTSPSANHVRKTHCPANHPYAGRNLIVDHKGRRKCRECANAGDRARWARRRTA